MRRLLSVLPLVAVVCVAGLYAQPPGAPCNYGYRPGNTWFYRSTSLQGGIYSETIVRDSIGDNGTYWALLTTSQAPNSKGSWFRIDSNCTFDLFNDPTDWNHLHWFVSQADSGDWWVVDSVRLTIPTHARVHAVHTPRVFGKQVRSKEVVYYPEGEIGDGWYRAEEWAESIGIIRKWFHPNGYDEIIGAIIDGVSYGVSYGVTTSVDERSTPNLSRLALWPLPATSVAMLQLPGDAAGDVAISIVDMNGAERYREHCAAPAGHVLALDVSGTPAGTYIVTATRGPQRLTAPLVVAR